MGHGGHPQVIVSIDEPARQLTWQRMITTLDGMRKPNPEVGLRRSSASVGGRRGSVARSTLANCATRSPTPPGSPLIVARASCFGTFHAVGATGYGVTSNSPLIGGIVLGLTSTSTR